MGDVARAGKQSQEQRPSVWSGRNNDRCSGGPPVRGEAGNPVCQSEKVYDLINCGPRNRYVVRPAGGGEPLIVHNCGFLYHADDRAKWDNLGANKINATIDLLEQLNEPVIVWTDFRALQNMILHELTDDAYRGRVFTRETVEEWKESPHGILVGNQTSGLGVGMNLQHAAANIYMTNSFSAEARWQSVKRTDRIGQERQVRVWDLTTPDTVEENVLEALSAKEEISRRTIDELRSML